MGKINIMLNGYDIFNQFLDNTYFSDKRYIHTNQFISYKLKILLIS